MAESLTMPLIKTIKSCRPIQEQCHSFYDRPNSPNVLALFLHLLVESQELLSSMLASTDLAYRHRTNHVLHHFEGSVATPIVEDMHPEIVLIPFKLLKTPFLVQFESLHCDDPILFWVCIRVSAAHAALVHPTPFAPDVTQTYPSLSIRVSRNLGLFVCRVRLFVSDRNFCGGGDLV